MYVGYFWYCHSTEVCDDIDNSCDGPIEIVEHISLLEIPGEDLSAVGDFAREITEYEKSLDDQLLIETSVYLENFKEQFQNKLDSEVQKTRDVFSKEAEGRLRRLKQEQENQLIMERFWSVNYVIYLHMCTWQSTH